MADKYSGYLEYITRQDAKVREEHALLNGVIKNKQMYFGMNIIPLMDGIADVEYYLFMEKM